MRNIRINKINGFSILAVILVIVAVIVAIGIWAMSGNSNTDSSSSAVSDIGASTLVNDSSSVKLAFDILVINGQNPETMIFVPNSNLDNNILNGISVPSVNPKILAGGIVEPEGNFVYANANMKKGGRIAKIIIVGGVNDGVCKKINKNAGNPEIFPKGMKYDISLLGEATKSNPMSNVEFDLTTNGAQEFPEIGCIISETNDGKNMFYRILKN